MPASKKTLRNQEAKKKEAAGTKVATTSKGVPVKPDKPKAQCTVCKAEIVVSSAIMLQQHADSRHPKSTFAECFPGR